MTTLRTSGIVLILTLMAMSCQQGPTVSTTKGNAIVECDESLFPIMKFQAEDFHNTYQDATIQVRSVEAREAVVDFLNDSVRVIVMGRQFNAEELDYLKKANIDYRGFKVALDAVVVITNPGQVDTLMRITELDSIYTGLRTRWGKSTSPFINAYIGDLNSSTDEVFKGEILNGKQIGPTIARVKSSQEIIDKVKMDRNAIGLIGVSWLNGHEQDVKECRLGGGDYRPVMSARASIEGTKNNQQNIVFSELPGQREREEFLEQLKQVATKLNLTSVTGVRDESQAGKTRIVVTLDARADADQALRMLVKNTEVIDTTLVPGQFFSPAQAHILRKYYPISREVYMYTREARMDVGYGFIAYVKDRKGQQNFVNHGLVPAAMPVRMVTTTADKVHQQ